MSRSSIRFSAALCLALSSMALTAYAAKDPYAKTRIFVPDTGNNRVLVYNNPTISGQAADAVLGQPAANSNTAATTATGMSAPAAYVVDDDGDLIVSDSKNCRLLVFKPPFTTGEAAVAVIGKPDFTTPCDSVLTPTATNLNGVSGVAIDENGNLWAADSQNNRVLHYKAPFKTNKAADMVIGQPDFTSNACPSPPTAGSLCMPTGVAIDSDFILWVADTGNNRVLGYKNPKKKMNANIELGHPATPTAFTSNTFNDGGISASTFSGPTGLAVDSKDHMWVADSGNNRVLQFRPDFKNGLAAKLVLGQKDFVSVLPNQDGTSTSNAAGFATPGGIVVQKATDIWVGDTNNQRTLQFVSPYATGMDASLVLGQPDFIHNFTNQGGGPSSPSDLTQYQPFSELAAEQAGPSWLALGVLLLLAGGWEFARRMRRKTAVPEAK